MSTINGIFNIVQILGMFFIAMLVKRLGKRNVFAIGLVLDIVGMLLLNFAGGAMAGIVVSSVIRGIGNACGGATMWAMVSDTIDYGEWKTGYRTEGLVNSACSFGYKIGNGIGSALLGVILEVGGYVGEAAVQSASALKSIEIYYLPRQLSKEVYEARIKIHRSEYITERDFVTIKAKGMEAVRIPVPYFIFGDREPFLGCIEELDKAFCWAKRYDLKVLIDLHTAPLGQNGFDNGGICGVCKWSQCPEEKYVVIHDGFELKAWKDFMQEEKYKNVVLDTHQYIMLAEADGCEQNVEAYKTYVKEHFKKEIQEMEAYFPVICGEWCLFNSLACGWDTKGGQSVLNGLDGEVESRVSDEEKRNIYRELAEVQLDAWNSGSGYFYWSYKLLTDTVNDPGWIGWDSWDFGRCADFGWFPEV